MTNFWYPHAIHEIGRAQHDLGTADLRVMLLLAGTTAAVDDANRDVTAIDQFGTLAEHTAAGRMVLANTVWSKDAAQNWSTLTADPTTWDPLPVAGGGEDVVSALLFLQITDDTDSFPVAYFDEGGYPVTPTGLTRHTINWHLTQGALLLRSG